MKIVIMNFIMKIEKIDAKQEHTLLDQCANNCRESGFMDGKKADIGIIGLAVMGENLAMNMESKGFTVAVYNRTVQKVADFVSLEAVKK
jgi:phosphoglycerate dehydrogenase-like enzyme